jgi:hypothetical protein
MSKANGDSEPSLESLLKAYKLEKIDSDERLRRIDLSIQRHAPFHNVYLEHKTQDGVTRRITVRAFEHAKNAENFVMELQKLYSTRGKNNYMGLLPPRLIIQKVNKINYDRLDFFSDDVTPALVYEANINIGFKV